MHDNVNVYHITVAVASVAAAAAAAADDDDDDTDDDNDDDDDDGEHISNIIFLLNAANIIYMI